MIQFGDAGFDDQQVNDIARTTTENDGALGAADTSIMTQSSQMGQKANETLELVQDRAQQKQDNVIGFGDLGSSTRAEAARRFYDILLLTTKDMLKVQQNSPFGEIQIQV